MARILLAWELGAGLGHLTRMAPIAHALEAKGHAITLAVRDLSNIYTVFSGPSYTTFQAPLRLGRSAKPINHTLSYSQLLSNVGYDDPEILTGLISAWSSILDAVNPDLMIVDHSPTALLAAHGRSMKIASISSGFEQPPIGQPFAPFLENLNPEQLNLITTSDRRILENINCALTQLKISPLTELHEIYTNIDEVCFLTLAEFDHFGVRKDVDYLGIQHFQNGQIPQWPINKKPKIYAYLKPFPKLDEFLSLLKDSGLNVLIYNNNLPQSLITAHSCDVIKFTDKPIDLKLVADQATLAIVNANHTTTGWLALNGLPCLMIPLHTEQSLFATRMIKTGTGIAVNKMDAHHIMAGLKHMLADDSYRACAKQLKLKYRDVDFTASHPRMIHRFEKLLAEDSHR